MNPLDPLDYIDKEASRLIGKAPSCAVCNDILINWIQSCSACFKQIHRKCREKYAPTKWSCPICHKNYEKSVLTITKKKEKKPLGPEDCRIKGVYQKRLKRQRQKQLKQEGIWWQRNYRKIISDAPNKLRICSGELSKFYAS